MSLQLVRGVDGHLTHFTTYFRQGKTIAIVSTTVAISGDENLVQLDPGTAASHLSSSSVGASSARSAAVDVVDQVGSHPVHVPIAVVTPSAHLEGGSGMLPVMLQAQDSRRRRRRALLVAAAAAAAVALLQQRVVMAVIMLIVAGSGGGHIGAAVHLVVVVVLQLVVVVVVMVRGMRGHVNVV